MISIQITLPESLSDFVDERVAQRGYGTSDEYVCELIRKDAERVHLRGLLLEGGGVSAYDPDQCSLLFSAEEKNSNLTPYVPAGKTTWRR